MVVLLALVLLLVVVVALRGRAQLDGLGHVERRAPGDGVDGVVDRGLEALQVDDLVVMHNDNRSARSVERLEGVLHHGVEFLGIDRLGLRHDGNR